MLSTTSSGLPYSPGSCGGPVNRRSTPRSLPVGLDSPTWGRRTMGRPVVVGLPLCWQPICTKTTAQVPTHRCTQSVVRVWPGTNRASVAHFFFLLAKLHYSSLAWGSNNPHITANYCYIIACNPPVACLLALNPRVLASQVRPPHETRQMWV